MVRPFVHSDPEVLRALLAERRRAGRSIGVVATMGSLHAGHLSLVQRATAECDDVVVTIFVNPLQFGPGEDLAAYPRDLEADLDQLEGYDVLAVLHPHVETFTPRLVTVHVARLTDALEGAHRPGHFDGVTTIVTKLLSVVRPDRAYFGEKDFQQQAVVRALVEDLALGVEVVTCPVVRDADGLALSSRNAYLTPEQRRDALALSRGLLELQRRWDGRADHWRAWLRATMAEARNVRLDYAEIVDPETLAPLEGVHPGAAQALVAAHVATTRLIDTIRLEPVRPDTRG